MEGDPEQMNNVLGTGGVLGCMSLALGKTALTKIEPVYDDKGDVTNQIRVWFSFLKSPYTLTVERYEESF